MLFTLVLESVSLLVTKCPKARLLKDELLRNIAEKRRGGTAKPIISTVEKLELLQSIQGKPVDLSILNGKWSLIYSVRDASSAYNGKGTDNIIEQVSALLYSFFFKFLPFLAGSSGLDKQGSSSFASNIQEINIEKGEIVNTVTLLRVRPRVKIVVVGECRASSSSSDTVDVIFTQCRLNDFLTIPLPRPKGSLRTTVIVDDDFRVGRGGQGGLFIVKRVV